MNPDCGTQLINIAEDTNVSHMAHIVPNAERGTVSIDNLILLCSNCHLKTEPLGDPDKRPVLRQWKQEAKQHFKTHFSLKCRSFALLEEHVRPLLARNYQIFTNYGPDSNTAENRRLWMIFEPELIANNSRLAALLTANVKLLHINNKPTVNEFLLHVDEFAQTRGDRPYVRKSLFPPGLLSMFGVQPEPDGLAQNVSALQNLIGLLEREERFVELSFLSGPTLTYMENDEVKHLGLDDRSRVQQLFFAKHLYRPNTTDLRLGNLCFFLQWLTDNDIWWEFTDYQDLTTVYLERAISSQAVLQLLFIS